MARQNRFLGQGLLALLAFLPSLAFAINPKPLDCCVAPDSAGTARLPAACPLASTTGAVLRSIIGGVPPGTELQSNFKVTGVTNVITSPGGSLGGQVEQAHATLTLYMHGTGSVADFGRTLTIPVQMEFHSAPRTPGQPLQSFERNLIQLQGQITGDPDFDLLRVTAGSALGMPSPGHTTLTRLPNGSWVVEGWIDMQYLVEFTATPGGALDGLSGSGGATALKVFVLPHVLEFATTPNNPFGSGNIPSSIGTVTGSGGATIDLVTGFPAGSPIRLTPRITGCTLVSATADPPLGPQYNSTCTITLDAKGEGSNGGYLRTFVVPHVFEHKDRVVPDPSASIQELDTDTTKFEMQIVGDPDFDLLRIRAGTTFGLPSPGHTTLTRLPDGDWAVYSTFDLTYTVTFVGHNGGPFGGHQGSTTGTIRMRQGGPLPAVSVPAFGLAHVALGSAQIGACSSIGCYDPNQVQNNAAITGDPNQILPLDDIGSSGNDGVAIDLGNSSQGWSGRIDFGLADALSSLLDLFVAWMFPGNPTMRVQQGDPNDALGGDPNQVVALSYLLQATPGVTHTLSAELSLRGAVVDSMISNDPNQLRTFGRFGTSGGVAPEFQWRLVIDGNNPSSSALEGSMLNPQPVISILSGSPRGPVLADRVVYRQEFGPAQLGKKKVSLFSGDPNTPGVVRSEGLVQGLYRARWSSNGLLNVAYDPNQVTYTQNQTQIGIAGVDAPGPFGPAGIILEADVDGDGEFEPLATSTLNVDLSADHELPPNGELNMDFVGATPPGLPVATAVRLRMSRDHSPPTDLGLAVFGFDPIEIQATARMGPAVVDSQAYLSPYPPSFVSGLLSSSGGDVNVTGDVSQAGGGGGAGGFIYVRVRPPSPTMFTLQGSLVGPVVADEIEFRLSVATLPPGTPYLDRINRVECRGTNLSSFKLSLGVPVVSGADPDNIDADHDGRGTDDDCNDAVATAWGPPSEARDLRLAADKQTLSWSNPFDAGAPMSAVVFDVLRATSPSNFASSTCVEAHDGSDRVALDPLRPPSGQLFAYLVRADNQCPGTGTLGSGSGLARNAPPCP